MPNSSEYRIYYEDTDAGGIVYYANYLKFAERARTDALRVAGISQSELMAKDGLGFVVTSCEMRFLGAAKLDDVISVETQLRELKKVRMSMKQTIRKNGEVLVALNVEIACVNRDFKPSRIPEPIAQALSQTLSISLEEKTSHG